MQDPVQAGSQWTEPSRRRQWMWPGIGVVLLLGTAVLTIRFVWEQTVWSWERGPQMIGFSFLHAGPGLIFLSCALALEGWIVATVAGSVWRLMRRRRQSRASLTVASLSVVVLAILHLPGAFWQTLFIDKFANGPQAGRYLAMAAGAGDVGMVRMYLDHGTPVDVRNCEGTTGLHAAAAGGHVDVIRFLIAAGADVNAVDRMGDSPLRVSNSPEGTRLLQSHGATIITGNEEQRTKAIKEMREESFRRIDRRDPGC